MDTLFCPFCHDALSVSLSENGSDLLIIYDNEECSDVYDIAQEYKCAQGHSVYISKEEDDDV
jgi:RNA polymerase subunit RPABC4/transcription elongation factor Spt4